MLFNAYLIYLATLISSYSFNTYNYIKNRKYVSNEKRKMTYKKNLSSETKELLKQAEFLPCATYFVSSLYSLIPLYNLYIPEKMKRMYYQENIDGIVSELVDEAESEEIIQRYINGAAIEVIKESGYEIPKTKIKEPKHATMNLDLYVQLQNEIDILFSKAKGESKDVFELEPISNKEFEKKRKKILNLRNKNNNK